MDSQDLLTESLRMLGIPLALLVGKVVLKVILVRLDRDEFIASLCQGGMELGWLGLGIYLLGAVANPSSRICGLCANSPTCWTKYAGMFFGASIVCIFFYKAQKPVAVHEGEYTDSLTVDAAIPAGRVRFPPRVQAVIGGIRLFWSLIKRPMLISFSWLVGVFMVVRAIYFATTI